MIKYLIKSTNEIRVDSEEDANTLHKDYEDFARDNGYILNSWSQTYRTKKLLKNGGYAKSFLFLMMLKILTFLLIISNLICSILFQQMIFLLGMKNKWKILLIIHQCQVMK